jgi:hypothetical protein
MIDENLKTDYGRYFICVQILLICEKPNL